MTTPSPTVLAARLRQREEALALLACVRIAGLAASDVAAACGVGRSTVYKWFSGTTPIPAAHFDTLRRLIESVYADAA